MIQAEQSMNSTKGFIYSKCKKDHLFSPSKVVSPKMKSLYARDFPKQNFRTETSLDKTKNVGKLKNQTFKSFGQMHFNLDAKGSIYKSSFFPSQTVKPELAHQKPSYFLKQEPYDKLISEYKRKMSPQNLKPQIIKLVSEKGKAKLGNLLIASTNRMSQQSEYQRSFRDKKGKLPTIHLQAANDTIQPVPRLKFHKKSNSSSLWNSGVYPRIDKKQKML